MIVQDRAVVITRQIRTMTMGWGECTTNYIGDERAQTIIRQALAESAKDAAAEMREACAKVCDDNSRMFDTASARAGSWIAAANAIRAIPIPLSPASQE